MKSILLLSLFSLICGNVILEKTKTCTCSSLKSGWDCFLMGCFPFYSNFDEKCRQKNCDEYDNESDCWEPGYNRKYCRWDTTCKNFSYNCSDYTTKLSCNIKSNIHSCVWNKKCEKFTKCSDYVRGDNLCFDKLSSTQKCQTSAGEVCENYTTNPSNCIDKTSAEMCEEEYSTCIWDTTCKEPTACSQAKSEHQCDKIPYQQCIFDTTCRIRVCSDRTTQITCHQSNKDFEYIEGILCQWNMETQKCTEASDPSFLTQDRCFLDSSYNFTWDSKSSKCTKCETLISYTEIIPPPNPDSSSSNSNPDSSSSNSGSSSTNSESSSTNSESNSTNSESSSTNSGSNSTNSGSSSSTSTTVFTDFNNHCACSELNQQDECKRQTKCLWENNKCRLITCADYTQENCSGYGCIWGTVCREKVCSDYETEKACDELSRLDNCSWNGTCSTFTKCSDYAPGISDCKHKSGSAQKCKNNTAGTACENVPTTTCSDFTSDIECYNSSIGLCNFDTTCKHITACNQFQSQTSCIDSRMCTYDTVCREWACSDYQKDNCYYVHTLQTKEGTNTGYLCIWDDVNSKCVAALDITHLRKDTCNVYTNQNYSWDGTKCSKCVSIVDSSNSGSTGADSSSTGSSQTASGIVLGMMVSLIVLLI